MGFNTSMIILNDALYAIEKDQDFGKKVADAVSNLDGAKRSAEKVGRPFYGTDISSGCNANAATVIETHHADGTALLAFGGNCVSILHYIHGYRHNDVELQVRMLEEWADSLGYKVVKKKTKSKSEVAGV